MAKDTLLRRGARALLAGRRDEARRLLEAAVAEDRSSEEAWLALALALDTSEERRRCLVQVLKLNPDNELAQRQLEGLDSPGRQSVAAGSRERAPHKADPEMLRLSSKGGGTAEGGTRRGGEGPSPAAPPLAESPRGRRGPEVSPSGLRREGPSPAASGRLAAALARDWPDTLAARPWRWALGYLAAIAVAEVLTAVIAPGVGLVLHALLLVALSGHAAATWDRGPHALFVTLTLAPLIRLLSLSLPLGGFPRVYWYLIVSIPLFAATVAAARVLDLGADEIGLNLRRPLIQLAVSVTGLLFGYLEYEILRMEPLADALTWREIWVPALILLISTGFGEELIFRGVMQRVAREVLGRWHILYVSALFAVLHIGYQSVLDVVFVFGVAVFFGWVTERTGSILGVTLSHGLTNIVLFLIAPFWVGMGGGL